MSRTRCATASLPSRRHSAASTGAGTGITVFSDGALNGPLGIALAFNGDILVVNSGDRNMVEITPFGQQAAVKAVTSAVRAGVRYLASRSHQMEVGFTLWITVIIP